MFTAEYKLMARHEFNATVISQVSPARNIYLLEVKAPCIATDSMPGQFCMLHPSEQGSFDPLLRRPLSIHDADSAAGNITFLYRQTGRGTKLLSMLEPGDDIPVLGPLGRGFSWEKGRRHIIAGGGMGMAPLLFLARKICSERETETGPELMVIMGAATRDELSCLDAFSHIIKPEHLYVATDDGSMGHKGFVTDLLQNLLEEKSGIRPCDCMVMTCGPLPMMRTVAAICRAGDIPCQVSLEAGMACGTGLCLSCAIPAEDHGYLHVCREGPVMDALKVRW